MNYLLISFKSRNSIFAFNRILKQFGISSEIINTPKQITMSCSLSLRIKKEHISLAVRALKQSNLPGFLGIFGINHSKNSDKFIRIV